MTVTLKLLQVKARLRRFSIYCLHSTELLEAQKINKAAPLNMNLHSFLSTPGDSKIGGFLLRDISPFLLPAGDNICDTVSS
jgi:hypothetical protein